MKRAKWKAGRSYRRGFWTRRWWLGFLWGCARDSRESDRSLYGAEDDGIGGPGNDRHDSRVGTGRA